MMSQHCHNVSCLLRIFAGTPFSTSRVLVLARETDDRVHYFSALQSQKAVTAYVKRKQLLPFSFARHYSLIEAGTQMTGAEIDFILPPSPLRTNHGDIGREVWQQDTQGWYNVPLDYGHCTAGTAISTRHRHNVSTLCQPLVLIT